MKKLLVVLLALGSAWVASAAGNGNIVFENARAKLVIGSDGGAKSLKLTANGEELLDPKEGVALFSVTQKRPFNNEIKLIHPNKRTTYLSNRIRRDGNRLVVGFETIPYEAVVSVETNDAFFAFRLEGFNVHHRMHADESLDYPPVESFRLMQLPVKDRANFGEWLGVTWDERAAVAVMSVSGLEEVDSEKRAGFRNFTADLREELGLLGGRAAIVAGAGRKDFLDAADAFERAMGLPLGVRSRRSSDMQEHIFCCDRITAANVDEWIDFCRKAGVSLIKWSGWYWPEEGFVGSEKERAELVGVLEKLHTAGIRSGLHILQTYVRLGGRYTRGACDPRLNLVRRFTLAEPIGTNDVVNEIRVLEDPVGAPAKYAHKRLLRFDGELFLYEKYEREPVRRFVGIRRAQHGTAKAAHARGSGGGVMDVSEFFGNGCYIDQRTDLQDEIARRIGALYDLGFDFFYFDGSEGASEPYGIFVPYSQYRVVRQCKRPIIFCEGAAKAHFDWHFLTGGNAFDVFSPAEFKMKTTEFALANAKIAARDFNRADFGWWGFYLPGAKNPIGTQFDMWEYGLARALAWDCMATMQVSPARAKSHARIADILETVRRWSDVRRKGLVPSDLKAKLREAEGEWHLYVNEKGGYEFLPLTMLASPQAKDLRAFVCERNGRRLICYWHVSGEGDYVVPLGDRSEKLRASDRAYLETALTVEEVKKSWSQAK